MARGVAFRIDLSDNVATLLADAESGSELLVIGEEGQVHVSPQEAVAAWHKVAISAISAGDPTIKFGSPIGTALVEVFPCVCKERNQAHSERRACGSSPTRPGLWLLDSVPDPQFMQFGHTNPNDTEGLMDLMSTGCQILMYTTGRGSVTGSQVAMTIKVTGNADTYSRMNGDVDFNTGRVLTGDISMDQAAEDLLGLIVQVAAGARSNPESLGHREYIIMYKHQSTPSLESGCRA